VLGILTFVPQWAVILTAGCMFYYDLFLALFLQTWLFVIFNKVMTAQYLLWWLTVMPLCAMNNEMVRSKKGLFGVCIVMLASAYSIWGYYAHNFEHNLKDTIPQIQYANYYWFAAQLFTCLCYLKHAHLTVTTMINPEQAEKTATDKVETKEKND